MFSRSHEESKDRTRVTFVGICIVSLCCFFAAAPATFADEPGFKIVVPVKTAGMQRPIEKLKVTVRVASEANVTFKVTDPRGGAFFQTFGPLNPSSAAVTRIFNPIPAGATLADLVSVVPLDVNALGMAPALGEPERSKYVFVFNLRSDGNSCVNAMAGPETWTIEVTAGPQIKGLCAQSLDSNIPMTVCGASLRNVPVDIEPIATVKKLDGTDMPTSFFGCRPAVDTVLVLDRSGSMSLGTGAGSTKIVALRNAVSSFMQVWTALRANDTSGISAVASPPDDQIGIVFFDTNANWLSDLTPSTINGLKPYPTVTGDVAANVPLVPPNSRTSIGGGLNKAEAGIVAGGVAGHRKVILLMTDGIQNENPMVSVPGAVQVSPPMVTLPVPPQIYVLGVGTGAAIQEPILQAIAGASGGEYKNTPTDLTILPNFFLEVLQNFVRFSTVETIRMGSANTSGTAPYQTTIPITTTTRSLTFHVDFDAQRGPLRLTLQPPGGVAPLTQTSTDGDLVLNQLLPVAPSQNSGGDWKVTIESLRGGTIPFNFILMGDDTALNSNLIAASADYAAGDKIKVQVRVRELEQPLVGLSTPHGDRMIVRLLSPNQSIGDVLSTSSASSTPTGGDPMSAAQAKLDNTLRNTPLTGSESDVTLLDNGDSSNGDAVAGDGIYSALVPTRLEGQYRLLFAIEGATQTLGRFSRMQLRTIHVRALPAPSETRVTSTVQKSDTGGTLVVNITPRTKFGNFVGPGWANYIWLSGGGITPVKPVDNLNGTYQATIPFTGGSPPPLKIHFIRDLVIIDDSTTGDHLPVPLDDGNVVTVVPPPTVGGAFKRWGLSLHAGVSIPHGNFDNLFNPGPNLGFDLEYRVTPTFSLEGIYGFHHFRGATIGSVTVGDVNVHQFSFNGKVYGSSSPVRPFFNFGGGAYVFTPGASTHGGLNVGGGVQFDVTPTFAVEGIYNFHNVFTSGSNTRFSALQGGVRFRF